MLRQHLLLKTVLKLSFSDFKMYERRGGKEFSCANWKRSGMKKILLKAVIKNLFLCCTAKCFECGIKLQEKCSATRDESVEGAVEQLSGCNIQLNKLNFVVQTLCWRRDLKCYADFYLHFEATLFFHPRNFLIPPSVPTAFTCAGMKRRGLCLLKKGSI